MKILFFIIILVVSVCFCKDSKELSQQKLNLVKKSYPIEKNLYLKTQMQIFLYPEEFSTDGTGEYFDHKGIEKAIKKLLFPFKQGFFEDWVIENAYERVNEALQFSNKSATITVREEFLEIISKLNPQNFVGQFIWNKVKDLTIDDPSSNFVEIKDEL